MKVFCTIDIDRLFVLRSCTTMLLQGRIVRVLIKAGANVNGRQSTGHTPLHCCAMEGQECMMKDLLQAGANPMLASVEGQTPLHTAAQVRPLPLLRFTPITCLSLMRTFRA